MDLQQGSLSHILAELKRIDLLIQAAISRVREGFTPSEEFQGVYVSEADVNALLARSVGQPPWNPESPVPTDIQTALNEINADITRRRAENNGTLRLEQLATGFNLSPFEVDALLICLAPELDLRYERFYAYLQDDATRRLPSVELVLNLCCATLEDKLERRRSFSAEASLIKHRLIHLLDDPVYRSPLLLSRCLKADPRIVDYLLDSDEVDEHLLPFAECISPDTPADNPTLEDGIKDRLVHLVQGARAATGQVFYFQGADDRSKRDAATRLCQEIGSRLLVIDGGRILVTQEADFVALARLACREARLQDAALYWSGFGELLADERRFLRDALLKELEDLQGLVLLDGNILWEPGEALSAVPFVRVEFALPTNMKRLQLWQTYLHRDELRADGLDPGDLASKFRLSGSAIRDAVTTARNLARARDPENGHVTMDDLSTACRLHSNRKLATLARKVPPHYTWDDIVLPRARLGNCTRSAIS